MMERLWSGGGCAGAARWAAGGEEEFWESKGLSMHDWPGLTGLVYTDIFSLDFLTPLDDQDTKFKLEVSLCWVPGHWHQVNEKVDAVAAALDFVGHQPYCALLIIRLTCGLAVSKKRGGARFRAII